MKISRTQGKPCQVAKAEMQHTDGVWRAHPIDYDDASYPWRVPPMDCASCGTKAIGPYRILRTDVGQQLLLHDACGSAMLHRLNPLPLGSLRE